MAQLRVPTDSRHAALDEESRVRATVADGLTLMLMLNVPATVGLVALATPIVRVIFERAAFTAADTAATAAALQFYAIGLVGYSVVRIASPVFYALGQNRTPVFISVATVLVNAALNVALVRVMGYRGLALGTSIAALFNATILMVLLRRRLEGIEGRRVASAFVRIAAASALMAAAAIAGEAAGMRWLPGGGLLPQMARLGLAIGVALAVLAASAHALHIREFRDGLAMVARRIRR
ncbi:MAG: polysaccharide biosynthesis C-terminal domain-containing protein [Acidobacteria bacterium]|nr:polysaccharide biosynthesis C-terminal domain-containing protein [Acidobacteriota bacterium]